ncbi:hypothetical protein GLOIN_2v1770737 [Rhizophagus clarus]|uniref:Uncharacterized protein n=1 Tax=Rhizophagus clarus TaxID=94130 RepID=A0A8H3M5K0_9GLOM|nr:hypothetical protein GLOIN_2v1770737 [Rhizophagus clarus]
MKKKPCLICEFPTDADLGKYIAKTGTLQLTKTSELSDETPQPTETFELSDVILQSRIYKAPVFESDDEDMGLDPFGD